MPTIASRSTYPASPDVYPGVRFDDYFRWSAVNASTLKAFAESAKAGRSTMLEPQEDTAALMVGRAAHAAVFEPDEFDRLYVPLPAFDGHPSSNKYKEAKAAWLAENGDKVTLKADEYDAARYVRDAVLQHPLARDLVSGKGLSEVSAAWTCKDEPAKGRFDRVTSFEGWPVMADLKTFRKPLSLFNIETEITVRMYHLQAAWYLDGAAQIAPIDGDRRWFFIWANNCAPWDVRVTELDRESIDQGRRDYELAFSRLLHGRKTGRWPGISTNLDVVSIRKHGFDGQQEAA